MAAKILIVDDDADLRRALAIVLRSLFTVLEASGGLEALALLKEERPSLVLLDVSMPGMSGLEVLAAAKDAHPGLVVVMLTSRKDVELAIRALNLGAVEYVTKPFDADYIRAEIARLIGPPGSSSGRPWRTRP